MSFLIHCEHLHLASDFKFSVIFNLHMYVYYREEFDPKEEILEWVLAVNSITMCQIQSNFCKFVTSVPLKCNIALAHMCSL